MEGVAVTVPEVTVVVVVDDLTSDFIFSSVAISIVDDDAFFEDFFPVLGPLIFFFVGVVPSFCVSC